MAIKKLHILDLTAVLLTSILITACTSPRQNTEASGSMYRPVATSTSISGATSNEYELVRKRDFGVWGYGATRSAIDPLHVSVNYKHDSISDLQAYVEANRAMAEQLMQKLHKEDPVWVSITFRKPLQSREEYQAQVSGRCQEIWSMQLDVGGTMLIGSSGFSPQPLSQAVLDERLQYGGAGVFGVDCTVRSEQLMETAHDPLVFLVDVTPTWVRRDLAEAGIADAMQVPVMVDYPYGWMERLGIVPTVPPPVGTTTPLLLTPAP